MAKQDPNADLKGIQQSRAQLAVDDAKRAKEVKALREKAQAEAAAKDATSGSGGGGSSQREVQCPFCASHVKKKDVSGGKKYFKIPFTQITIPIPPFLAGLLKPDPQKCSCEGKQKIKDVSDDSAKYAQVKQQAQAMIPKSIELEAKMGTGGNRTTFIEKSETLMVGLGFNRNDSYEIVEKANVAPSTIVPDPKTGAAFAKGIQTNQVKGIQAGTGWPSAVGNYKIVCANSYNLVAGSGGVQLNTKGPLTISGGITSITGPMVTIGSSSGPLTLEGDVVSVSGKTISLTPTEGNVFVKGTISSTGNVVVGGQLHAETLSFCKASCPSTEQRSTSQAANQDVTQTHAATWGGVAVTAITTAVMDLMIYFSNVISDPDTSAVNLLSPTQMLNTMNRMVDMANLTIPIELIPTGIAFGLGVSIVYNWPHTHGLPELAHSHATTVPDIDCKNYSSPQALRAAVMNDSLISNAPVVPTNKIQELIQFVMRLVSLPGQIMNEILNRTQDSTQSGG